MYGHEGRLRVLSLSSLGRGEVQGSLSVCVTMMGRGEEARGAFLSSAQVMGSS